MVAIAAAGILIAVSMLPLGATALRADPADLLLLQPKNKRIVKPEAQQPPEDKSSETGESPELRKLTEKEIQRIRFLELRGSRLGTDSAPESITVKLDPKIAEEFLTIMQGKPNYTGNQARSDFLKLTAAQKVHLIAAERGPEFADKIHITSDPEVFVEFRRKIMPIILRGCATTGCHGPTEGESVKFHLFKDPKKTPDTTYANFVILNDVVVDGVPILNRSQPENSLLLSYMIPTKDVRPEARHPGREEIKPLFQTRSGSEYKRIEKWIASLKHPAEDYGVHLLKREFTTSMPEDNAPPAEKPATEQKPAPPKP